MKIFTQSTYPFSSSQSMIDIHQELIEAMESQSYDKVCRLIQQGANCHQLITCSSSRIIKLVNDLLPFDNFDDETILELLKLDLHQDAKQAFVSAHNKNVLARYTEKEMGVFHFLVKSLEHLPLPLLAILEQQKEIVEALEEKNVYLYNLKSPTCLDPLDLLKVVSIQSNNHFLNDYYSDLREQFYPILSSLFFLAAVQKNNLAIQDLFIKLGLKIGIVYDYDNSLLDAAVSTGNYKVTKQCLERKHANKMKHYYRPNIADFDFFNLSNNQTVLLAAIGGNVDILQLLLDSGYKINPPTSPFLSNLKSFGSLVSVEKNPFAQALYHGHLDVAKWLLEHGMPFDPSLADDTSLSIFISIVAVGKPDQLQFLLDYGCPINFKITQRDLLEEEKSQI